MRHTDSRQTEPAVPLARTKKTAADAAVSPGHSDFLVALVRVLARHAAREAFHASNPAEPNE
jgi:hypothetical protein